MVGVQAIRGERRVVASVIIALLISFGPMATVGIGTVSATTEVTVTDVSVTPETPAPGEPVTVRVTIQNSGGSPAALTDVDVALRGTRPYEDELEYSRVRDLGSIAPGSSTEVPLSATFDEPGVKELRVHIWGTGEGATIIKQRWPVTVRVSDEVPKIDADINDTVAGLEESGTVTVSNGLDSSIRNVEVTMDAESEDIEISDNRSVFAMVSSGDAKDVGFTYDADEAGTYELTARLEYTVGDGQVREIIEQFQVDVEPQRGSVSMRAEAVDGTVQVEILNTQNLPIRNVVLNGESENATVEQTLIDEMSADSSRTLNLTTKMDEQRADVDVTMRYDVADSRMTLSDSVTFSSVPGQIELTGIEFQFDDRGRLTITGSASNVGMESVDSAVVSVRDTAHVTPVPPNREYFVGTVPSSDFVSFEVYAALKNRVDRIPLEVTYLVDDERRTETFDVAFDPVAARPEQAEQSATTADMVVGFLVLAVLGSGVVYAIRKWRARRAST